MKKAGEILVWWISPIFLLIAVIIAILSAGDVLPNFGPWPIAITLLSRIGGVVLLCTYSSAVRNGPLILGKIVKLQELFNMTVGYYSIKVDAEYTTTDGQIVIAQDLIFLTKTLDRYRPGNLIPIRYDTKYPKKIKIIKHLDDATYQQLVDEYKQNHGGKLPPIFV